MARTMAVGIDVGTSQVKVVVARADKNRQNAPSIVGRGVAEAKGLRHGYVMNQADATRSVAAALAQAEKTSGEKIRKAYLAVGGIGLGSVISLGSTVASRADSEITELDLKKALESAETAIPESQIINRKILHAIPLQYKIDGKVLHGRALGMKGLKIEVKALFVTCLLQHLQDLIQAVEETGVEVEDVMAAPLAASLVTLTKAQKIAGCVLANIGAETVSLAVFENTIPISLEVFPIGSTDITNDIALGLKVPLDEAEQIKLGGITATPYPRRKLEEIIDARLSDIFELIESHLKKINRNGLLPAGIIITGGASGIATIEDLARSALRLPSKVGLLSFGQGSDARAKEDMNWAVALGLCILGLSQGEGDSIGVKLTRVTGGKILSWFKQFLP